MKEKNEFLIKFGAYVKHLREEKGWTQDELAEKCGYTSVNRKSTVSKIEKGESDLPASKIKTLATIFGTSPSDLIDPPEEPSQQQELCDLFSLCYGKEAYQMVQSFLKLDKTDQYIVYGEVLGMLKADKYTDNNVLYTNAAHERVDIPYDDELQDQDNAIMDDDNF